MTSDKKTAAVLSAIAVGNGVNKLEIKKQTGFSATTVLSAVSELLSKGAVTVKAGINPVGGKPPDIVSIAPDARLAVFADNGFFDGEQSNSYTLTEYTLKGEKDSSVGITPEGIAAALTEGKYQSAALLSSDDLFCDGFGAKGALDTVKNGCPLTVCRRPFLAAALDERYYSRFDRADILCLNLGDSPECYLLEDDARQIDVSNLLSPVISSSKGRLPYSDMLSAKTVAYYLNRYSGDRFSAFESGEFIGRFQDREKCFAEQLTYALGELLLVLDRTIRPNSIAVSGRYISDELLTQAEKSAGEKIYAKVCQLTVSPQCGSGAALHGICYY